jgi:hypothetical protein
MENIVHLLINYFLFHFWYEVKKWSGLKIVKSHKEEALCIYGLNIMLCDANFHLIAAHFL